ncbi:Hypothetical_protein [Hexamita inflata]|uniref:Hypothetical_protein n=1 Tax=Hexamita inflata TaxID=28002 RepID=A0AA86UD25_9EUKA|nr:Hypothetical protein HINF_LOCUS24768 [Hexamita inflata]
MKANSTSFRSYFAELNARCKADFFVVLYLRTGKPEVPTRFIAHAGIDRTRIRQRVMSCHELWWRLADVLAQTNSAATRCMKEQTHMHADIAADAFTERRSRFVQLQYIQAKILCDALLFCLELAALSDVWPAK